MTKEITCSIIIRCYNEEQHIGRLLSSIIQQTIKNIEIIVVDSGSTDTTLSIISNFPVKIIYISKEDFSFGKALNVGCEAASGKYLVFISAHCWPEYDNWLKNLLSFFCENSVALVYGKQRGNENTNFSEHQIFKRWFPDKPQHEQSNYPFCNNANCAIRRDVWEQVPYDEEITGLEDIDWAKKIIEKGFKIKYSKEASIFHIHKESAKYIYNRYRREAIALKSIFPNEKFTILDFIHLSTINILSDCYSAFKKHILIHNIKSIIIFRYMQFLGAYRGFLHRKTLSKQLKQTFYYPKK